MNKKIITAGLLIVLVLFTTGCSSNAKQGTESLQEEAKDISQEQPVQEKEEPYVPVLGDSFHFDGFDVILGEKLGNFKTVDNKYSENYQKDVIVLPIKIINLSGEIKIFNPMYMTVYSPDGTQAKKLGVLYMDDDIYGVGKMMHGGEKETNVHIEYKVDGYYFIEFNNFQTSGMAKIPVQKESE